MSLSFSVLTALDGGRVSDGDASVVFIDKCFFQSVKDRGNMRH